MSGTSIEKKDSLDDDMQSEDGRDDDANVFQDTDRQWEDTPMTDTIKITTFAGQTVPEDGLVVHPPQGGELTIWPDGGYAFMPPEGGVVVDGQAPVTTYYSFVMEDVDGSTSVGTFALNPAEEVPGAMDDFQAWSLPELLHDEGDASLLLAGGHDVHVDAAAGAVDAHVPALHVEFMGSDTFDDDLTRLILHSQNS